MRKDPSDIDLPELADDPDVEPKARVVEGLFDPNQSEFRKGLQDLLNRHSMENGSNTPDFILATFLTSCLVAFDAGVAQRTKWYEPPGDSTGSV